MAVKGLLVTRSPACRAASRYSGGHDERDGSADREPATYVAASMEPTVPSATPTTTASSLRAALAPRDGRLLPAGDAARLLPPLSLPWLDRRVMRGGAMRCARVLVCAAAEGERQSRLVGGERQSLLVARRTGRRPSVPRRGPKRAEVVLRPAQAPVPSSHGLGPV